MKPCALQKLPGFGENSLGLIAQTEERLLAAGGAALFRSSENFVRRHEVRARLAGIFAEGAVAAVVAAQRGERDKNFLGVGDRRAFAKCAEFRGGGEEFGKRRFVREAERRRRGREQGEACVVEAGRVHCVELFVHEEFGIRMPACAVIFHSAEEVFVGGPDDLRSVYRAVTRDTGSHG